MLDSFIKLEKYCAEERYKGWDPFDGLNSKVLQTILPLKHSAILRLIVIQGFKRCPWNLRKPFMVPKQYNTKGIGLFLQGYCNLYKLLTLYPALERKLGTKEETRSRIHELSKVLLELR